MSKHLQNYLSNVIIFNDILKVKDNELRKLELVVGRLAKEMVDLVQERFEAKEAWRVNSNTRRRIRAFTGADADSVCQGLMIKQKKGAHYEAAMDQIWTDLAAVKTVGELYCTIDASKYFFEAFEYVITGGNALRYVTAPEKEFVTGVMTDLYRHVLRCTVKSTSHPFFKAWNSAEKSGLYSKMLSDAKVRAEAKELTKGLQPKVTGSRPRIL